MATWRSIPTMVMSGWGTASLNVRPPGIALGMVH